MGTLICAPASLQLCLSKLIQGLGVNLFQSLALLTKPQLRNSEDGAVASTAVGGVRCRSRLAEYYYYDLLLLAAVLDNSAPAADTSMRTRLTPSLWCPLSTSVGTQDTSFERPQRCLFCLDFRLGAKHAS